MSSGNVIAINGQYTIKYINISGEEVALTSHESAFDILSISYQGHSYMVHVDDDVAINGEYNNFSIVEQLQTDMSSYNITLRLRNIVDGN